MITKVALFFLVTSSIFWLGGVNIRAVIGNELLQIGTLEFEPNLEPSVEREIFRLMNYSSIVILLAYTVVFFSSIVYLSTIHLKLKENGWLLMSAVLFYMFSPAEWYTNSIDAKMVVLELFGKPQLSEFRELFIKRLAALRGVPIIALFCYYTILGLVVWRPMRKQQAIQPSL